ncbi:UDP-glucose dehydrogenase family protein [Brevibacillus sp. SYSU BS000544]|uniref:UDP-glucose dehydrogenase family protein n=1 Tax=Brevibacillus sp. SYSU BS000544 TaxID=3416443 RepID=UPI003CE54C3D
MKLAIIGSGYVGLTAGMTFAYLGNHVTFLDSDQNRITTLLQGELPFYEPGLHSLFRQVKQNVDFLYEWSDLNWDIDVLFITVGTPPQPNGDVDLRYVEAVAQQIGEHIPDTADPLIVMKSTVPIGSADKVAQIIQLELNRRGSSRSIQVVANPEFLREGEALRDAFFPDRIIVGTENDHAAQIMQALYEPLIHQTFTPPVEVPVPKERGRASFIVTNPKSSELIKYAANSFLAMKISFINEFSQLAEAAGADIKEIAYGIGLDQRIGTKYLQAGLGWGGSCFGKDLQAIIRTAEQHQTRMKLLQSVVEVNQQQREWVHKRLCALFGQLQGLRVGILGVSFKPNTDDLRDAVSIAIIEQLVRNDVQVTVFDPIALERLKLEQPQLEISFAQSAGEVFYASDAVILVTEWEEFQQLPLQQLREVMNHPVFLDGRNAMEPKRMRELGFIYEGVGRRTT